MLQIMTDGAGDMPFEWLADFELHVIPISIQFQEKTYLQGVDMSNADFYHMVEESGVIPKTSQPTPYQFVEFYRRIAQPSDTIISIHVTSKLSGTFHSAELAARELEGEYNVIPFDSGVGSAGLGYMCREAREMSRSGKSIEAILERLQVIRQQMQIILTLDTLDYARMSGRVKTLQAALVSMLNVKPIVEIREGVLEAAGKVRTRKKSLQYVVNTMKERMGDQLLNVAVAHAQDIEAGKQVVEMVRDVLNCKNLVMTDLSISVAANLGVGTVGLIAYPVGE